MSQFCTFNLIVNPTDESSCGACDGQAQAFVFGGTGPFSYLWNDPAPQQTTATATGLCAGNYTVTVTDGLGCSKTATTTVGCPGVCNITLFSTSQNETSCGACDGEAGVFATNGTSPYTYLWSDGQTTSGATGLCSGTYTVTVTDAAACTDTATRVVSCPGACDMVLDTIGSNESSCGACDGWTGVMPSAGNPPYTFLWSDPANQTGQQATALCSGTYTVTVTDNAGCTETATETVTCTGCSFTLFVIPTDESACGICDGEAEAIISGGSGPFTYLWDDPGAQTDDVATGLCLGLYSVVVTDGFGCPDTASGIVSCPGCKVIFTTASTGETGCGSCDGTATANPTSGIPPYTFMWNTFPMQIDSTATGLCAGAYSVTVSDAAGCSDTATVNVSPFTGTLSLSPSSTPETGCGTCDGTASAGASGGTPPFTYVWSTFPIQTGSMATGLCPGLFSVSVSDGAGCSDTATVSVLPFVSSLVLNTSSSGPFTCGGCDATATVTTSGGTPPYTYLWNTFPPQFTSTATGLCAGTYSVNVEDSAGCSDTAGITINPYTGTLTISSTSTTPTNCISCNGTATVTPSGGILPYTYMWNTLPVQLDSTAT
ncbi:MAG: SprB repeat-containing protein, partial [Bacteroidetes bacterium]|nr:SprB repeat-containing protein [Bacteroidota bacterium]